jgi:hypothetical protein
MKSRGRLLVWVACAVLGLALFVRVLLSRRDLDPARGVTHASRGPEVAEPSPASGRGGEREGSAPRLELRHESELTAERVEALLKELWKKHASAHSRFESWEYRFLIETSLFYREARLSALAFPQVRERVASAMALDPSASPVERAFAAWTLSMVATTDHPGGVSAILQSLTQDGEPLVRDVALGGLALSDKNGQLKSLYWEACRKGSLTGFSLVSQWLDPGTISEMKAILAQQPTNKDAQRVLQRMDILATPQWEPELGRILEESKDPDMTSQWWALEIFKSRGSKVLMETLRNRLDRGLLEARREWEAEKPTDGASFEKAFATSAEISKTTRDSGFDDLLVGFYEAHGQLNDMERARLRTFGYGCDPKQRLEELLSTGK